MNHDTRDTLVGFVVIIGSLLCGAGISQLTIYLNKPDPPRPPVVQVTVPKAAVPKAAPAPDEFGWTPATCEDGSIPVADKYGFTPWPCKGSKAAKWGVPISNVIQPPPAGSKAAKWDYRTRGKEKP